MPEPKNIFVVSTEVLDLSHYLSEVTDPAYGAVASFVGTVRSPNLGEDVLYIDYEGYEAMIKTQMQIMADELRARLELGHLVLAHRLGRLNPGEASIAIVASSKHRKDALLACQAGIDRAKDLLPIWKYEVNPKNKTWVKGNSSASTPL